MKVKIKVEKEIEITTLEVFANVRYWEDTEVNEVDDTEEGDNIPCKVGNIWNPIIDIETGVIINWEKGKTANVHYKVVDECSFGVLDDKGNVIFKQENDYVPEILYPKENGFGDYIIMDIDESGKISNWNKELIRQLIQ